MGAGKSTLAKRLSKQLSETFIDTDHLIEAAHGSIAVMFDRNGEQYFRTLEEVAFARALNEAGIIATGGGTVLSSKNRELMTDTLVVFLDTTLQAVVGRASLDKRPLIRDNPDRWQEIYNQRLPLYRSVADIVVFTGTRPIRELLAEIVEKIEHHEL
jgi:shikimate kinase